ncbi:UNVERIFIED_CONTAM: hypothetical protein HDU68_003442 [Siphonaria sp. JEL0065]|nr:hypothetical protein HDU68_003442 [Siphonaria sp. JEL0065]
MFATQATYQPVPYHIPTVDCSRRQSLYAAPSSPQVSTMTSPAISSLSTFSTFSTVSTSSSMIGAGGINLLLDSPELSPVVPLFPIPELSLQESHSYRKQQYFAPAPVPNHNSSLPSIRSALPPQQWSKTPAGKQYSSALGTAVKNLSSVLPLLNPTTMNTPTQDPTAALTALPNSLDVTIS